jgi:PRTRC genetic system protein A
VKSTVRLAGEKLTTPLYVKTDADMPWPEDESVFYVLSADGLFFCRNHRFFRSSVPARSWPTGLAPHVERLELRHPKIPRRQIELLVGFFDEIAAEHGAEAAALLIWDRNAQRTRLHVPPQRSTVFEGWSGSRYPGQVYYDVPHDLPAHWSVIGDVHSHADEAAYASATDQADERHRPGVHLVIGRVYREPPEMHCEFVVDGTRFRTAPALVLAGYERRNRRFPRTWLDRVTVEVHRPGDAASGSTWKSGNGGRTYDDGDDDGGRA